MEKKRREVLGPVVKDVRERIVDSLGKQLVAQGLFRDAPPLDEQQLTLTAEQRRIRPQLLEAITRQGRAVGKEGITPEAVSRFVREAGGTWVNRLAALRALEVRGFLDPPAALCSEEYGDNSPRGQLLRERAAGEGKSLNRDQSLRAGIEDACRELSKDVRVLFDLNDEHSLVWPDAGTLRQVLGQFSTTVTHEDWSQPDVLGWVYQYYNTDLNAALKKKKNTTTGFKYTADDIPVANQFYTPHWVVRVLADNTLGRLWLESEERLPRLEQDPWRLAEQRQGIPHAAGDPGGFEAWFREEPDPLKDGTVDRLCRFLVPLPSRAILRPRKSPREIRVLDPACGSGHFLLYAFDILFVMYREAEPHLDPREIPALILRDNLFGIDIDLRAAQLAAFNLYLKARTVLATLDPTARFEVQGLNIVVADAHVGDDPRKAGFLARFKDDPEIRALYEKVLSSLDHTNSLGSLLKVRTEFEGLFGKLAAKKSAASGEPSGFGKRQQVLLDVKRQRELGEVFTSHSGAVWTIESLLAQLELFEREAAPGQDIGARLFYTDLERSVGLLALLSRQYDVVLMNPPYGDMPPEAKDYLKGNAKKKVEGRYPRTHSDLYAAFLEQGLDLAVPNGFLGALVPWTYMFLSSLEDVRTQILCGEARPELLQVYGYGVLDGATVGTVGTVARKLTAHEHRDVPTHHGAFERLSDRKKDWEKQARFVETFPRFAARGPDPEDDWFVARLGSFQDVPGMPYAYWASDSLRSLFKKFPPLDRDQKGVLIPGRPDLKIADVKQGLATADDGRFVRHRWEIPPQKMGQGKRWVPFVKGGREVRFYARTDLVVNWEDDGREVKEFPKAVIRNPQFYFRPGVTWPRASWRLRKFGSYPGGCVFADKGSSVFGKKWSAEAIAGLLNSSVGVAGMLMQTPERMWEIGLVSTLPMPLQGPGATFENHVASIRTLHLDGHKGDETCRDFATPDLREAFNGMRRTGQKAMSLSGLLETVRKADEERQAQIAARIRDLDVATYELYGLSHADRELIEREVARRAESESGRSNGADEEDDEELGEESEEEAATEIAASDEDLVSRWLSHYAKHVLEADEDGIIPVAATRLEPGLVVRVKDAIEHDLGKDAASALLSQAPAYLGVDTVDEWLATKFFPWHVDLHRKRPLFWLISSESFGGSPGGGFRAYVHYLKLTPDTLPRLVSHYLEPAMDAAQSQLADARLKANQAEGRAKKAATDDLERWLAETDALRKLKDAIEAVVRGPAKKAKVAANAKWVARTIADVRGGQDAGHGYRPDVDYGVKVNITPLAEARLLPKSTLKKLGG